MLRNLHIENIAVIDRLDVEFDRGFHVLTGETGAGKSILIDSINMLLGERTSRTMIRHGQDKALVQGLFTVENQDARKRLERQGVQLEEDGSLLLQRELHPDGRNVCRAGGAIITVSAMKAAGSLLVNIHGQHDSQALLDQTSHINFLDRFAKEEMKPLLMEYVSCYNKVAKTKRALSSLQMDEKEKQRRLDILKYELEEIGNADLREGEEAALEKKRDKVNNAKQLLKALTTAYEAIRGDDGSAYDLLSAAKQEMLSISEWDTQYEKIRAMLDEITATVEECARDVRVQLDGVTVGGEDINQIEARLDVIYSLKRKYGGSEEAVLAYYHKILAEQEQITTSGAKIAELTRQLSKLMQELKAAANALHEKRQEAAAKLEDNIKKELDYLDMHNINFKVDFQEMPFNPHGLDRVEFLISTNPGQPLRPLSKIVSGGELSRIMLAMKSILADSDMVGTFIFDEIDTGVSGRAAQKIGTRIAELSGKKQILCITHLAAIAALADNHYLIEKSVTGGQTSTAVRLLDENGQAEEIARMISGDNITETTLAQARQMMKG